jgi:hypothetical protein
MAGKPLGEHGRNQGRTSKTSTLVAFALRDAEA